MKTKQALLVYYNVIYGRFFPLFNVIHSRSHAHTHIQTRIHYAVCSVDCALEHVLSGATTNGAAVSTAELKYYVNSMILICSRSKYVYHVHLHFSSIYC